MRSDWHPLKLRDVCTLINGRAYSQPELLESGKYRVLRVGNFFTNDHWYYSDLELDENKYCDRGDLLYAWSASFGPRIWTGEKVIFHYHIWKVIPNEALIDKTFLFMFLLWDKELIKQEQGTGTTMIHVSKGSMEERDIWVPSLPEQRQTVAKLKDLLTSCSGAREELKRVPRLVERYKQAIVAQAFQGELTAAYRKTAVGRNGSELKHELTQRRSAAIKKAGSKEKPASPPTWKPDLQLPDQWTWVSVDELSTVVQYGSSAKTLEATAGECVPVLRMGNIQQGRMDYRNLKYLPADHHEFPELLLEDGDILFNRTNSAELVGKTGVYRDNGRRTSFASYLIRLQLVGYVPELLAAYMNSEFGRQWVRSVVNQQVGQANVNGTKLRQLGVPFPSIEEQLLLWAQIKERCEAIERVSSEATRAEDLLARLEQATLAKAFRGELVLDAKEPALNDDALDLVERNLIVSAVI